MDIMQFDRWTQFVVQTVIGATLRSRRTGKPGEKVVQERAGGYRHWDPETLLIDKDMEDLYLKKIGLNGIKCTVITEEAGVVKIGGKEPENGPVYIVCDPFDGSSLFKRDIQAFWYTTLAVFEGSGNLVSNAVGDCLQKRLYYCDAHHSYAGNINLRKLEKTKPVKPSTVTELKDAYLEVYLMKPYFMFPAFERLKDVFNAVKFIVPNGGPGSLCNVASGVTEVNIGLREPCIDFFTGKGIAEKAGCIVTDLAGNPIRFDPDINKQYDFICAANEELHRQALNLING